MMNSDLIVKKTTSADFEKIYPLLCEFHSPFSKQEWRSIFDYQWDGCKDHVGYHLEKGDTILGFMGLIFSSRNQHNQAYSVCNITSLIVKSDMRFATALLLRKLSQYADTIFTGLGPIPESYQLMCALGFTPLDHCYSIIPVLNTPFRIKNHDVISCDDKIDENASDEEKRIYEDHKKLKCKFLFMKKNSETVLLVYHVSIQKKYGLRFTKIHLHYASNIIFFRKNLRTILGELRQRFGILSALYADNRWISDDINIFRINRKMIPPRIFRKNQTEEMMIDSLYSEAVLLIPE